MEKDLGESQYATPNKPMICAGPSVTNSATETNQDDLIIAQEKKIADEIKATVPMIGPLEALETLQNEFSQDEIYSLKVSKLKSTYTHMRRTRPDGNCFLRGFIFAYLEYCVRHKEELSRFRKLLEESKEELFKMGFPKFTTEDFYDMFLEVITDLESCSNVERVESICNDSGTSDYLVVYLRLLISAHLQKNAEFFSFFIEGGRTIEEFCSQEVEPMFRECDHLHIVALTATLGVGVCVMYLDRGDESQLATHNFPEDKASIFTFLYRPGHYDLLYRT